MVVNSLTNLEKAKVLDLKLDLGCGKRKQEGFIGVDKLSFDGVDQVFDFGKEPWPWDHNSISEVYCAHVLEHLKPAERIHFANELCRVLKKEAKALIITPHWASMRAFGDLTHEWPPVVPFWYSYLNKAWREENAPHNTFYTCDFDYGYGFSIYQAFQARNQEFQTFAATHYLEGAQDLHVTLTKR